MAVKGDADAVDRHGKGSPLIIDDAAGAVELLRHNIIELHRKILSRPEILLAEEAVIPARHPDGLLSRDGKRDLVLIFPLLLLQLKLCLLILGVIDPDPDLFSVPDSVQLVEVIVVKIRVKIEGTHEIGLIALELIPGENLPKLPVERFRHAPLQYEFPLYSADLRRYIQAFLLSSATARSPPRSWAEPLRPRPFSSPRCRREAPHC